MFIELRGWVFETSKCCKSVHLNQELWDYGLIRTKKKIPENISVIQLLVGFKKTNTLCCFAILPDTNQLEHVFESGLWGRVCGYQSVSTPCWFGPPDRHTWPLPHPPPKEPAVNNGHMTKDDQIDSRDFSFCWTEWLKSSWVWLQSCEFMC